MIIIIMIIIIIMMIIIIIIVIPIIIIIIYRIIYYYYYLSTKRNVSDSPRVYSSRCRLSFGEVVKRFTFYCCCFLIAHARHLPLSSSQHVPLIGP